MARFQYKSKNRDRSNKVTLRIDPIISGLVLHIKQYIQRDATNQCDDFTTAETSEKAAENLRVHPSWCDWKRTPSSSTRRSPSSEKTWKPPLSVRNAPGQLVKPCSPPNACTTSEPGRRNRWYSSGIKCKKQIANKNEPLNDNNIFRLTVIGVLK